MTHRPISLSALLLAGFWLIRPLQVRASTTYDYPKDRPAMSMEIPDGWRVEEGNTNLHQLSITKVEGGDVREIKIMTLPARYAEVPMRDALKKVIGLTTADPNFTDVQIREPQDDKMPTGMAVVLSEVRCKVKGANWRYLFVIFSPAPGSYCEMVTASPEGKSNPSEKAAQLIANSILPR